MYFLFNISNRQVYLSLGLNAKNKNAETNETRVINSQESS